MKPIKFRINQKDMTIEISMARLIMPEIELGAFLKLGDVINPETSELVNITVQVVEDDLSDLEIPKDSGLPVSQIGNS